MKHKKITINLPKEKQPKEKQPEEKDNFLDDLLELSRIGNNFQHDIENAILNFSKEDFDNAYNKHKAHLERDKPNKDKKDERDIRIALVEYITCALIEVADNKEFKDNCGLEYYEVVSDALAPRIMAFTLWAAGKKEPATQVLEKYPCNIKDKEYDDFYEILKFGFRLHNQPFDHKEKEELYKSRKEEFLFVQNKLKLVKELSEMPTQEVQNKTKKTKI